MASACVTMKANTNTHLANSKTASLFGQDNGFLIGERIRGSLNNNKNSAWVTNQLAKHLTTQKRVKPGAVSAVLTSDDAKGSLVSTLNLNLGFNFYFLLPNLTILLKKRDFFFLILIST